MTIHSFNSQYFRYLLSFVIAGFSLFAFSQTSNQVMASDNTETANAPATITLQDALQRAKKINPEYHAAVTEYGIAKEDRVQSRAALLPSANFNGGFIYTEGGGIPGVGRFVANNGVHEYVSQGNAHEAISLAGIADYQRTKAVEAQARAREEIATRGLVVTVTQAYYGFVIAQRKYANQQSAAAEARHFFDTSQKLERGGEVAHSDSIKAQILFEQTQRDLREADLDMNRSRLELAILIFPDFNQNFAVVDDLQTPMPLPPLEEIQDAAARENPMLRSAVAALQAARQEVVVAWNGFLPSLTLDYFYGIDATHFAVKTDGIHNVGYAASATLQVPVWNWGASRSKLKQASLKRGQAQVELSFAQRQLLANLRIRYDEAQAARAEMDSLRQSAELAADSVRLTSLRYQAGEALVLEVVDAQTTLTQARNALNDGEVRFRVAMANLQILTGNL